MLNFLRCRHYGIFCVLLNVLFLALFWCTDVSAQGSKDMRTAVAKFVSNNWPGYNSQNIEYRMAFPINGGKITGTGTEIYHFLVPVEFDDNANATKHEKREQTYTFRLEGQFNGGDGGTLTGKVIPNQHIHDSARDFSFSGKLYANGKGVIRISGSDVEVTFTPFGECCNKDLGSYPKAIRDVLIKELIDKATPYLHAKLLKIIDRGMKYGHSLAQRIVNAGKTMYEAVRTKINSLAKGRFALPPLNAETGFLKKLDDAFVAARKARSAGPAYPLLSNMTDNIEKCLSVLQTLDAASDGAYGEAAFAASVGAVGAYSNLAGLALALGQAAKEDWDGFCETNYESEFRRFYRKIYFEGGQLPSERVGRAGVQARLKDFMEECLEWLSAGGGSGAELRKMLIDFSHYKMGLSKNRDDFKVVEGRKGKLVMASRADATVLAALFQAYEQVFAMDLEAERVRKATLKRYADDKNDIRNIQRALTDAERGNFDGVWPKTEYNEVFCEMYHRLEKEGKLKGAGK